MGSAGDTFESHTPHPYPGMTLVSLASWRTEAPRLGPDHIAIDVPHPWHTAASLCHQHARPVPYRQPPSGAGSMQSILSAEWRARSTHLLMSSNCNGHPHRILLLGLWKGSIFSLRTRYQFQTAALHHSLLITGPSFSVSTQLPWFALNMLRGYMWGGQVGCMIRSYPKPNS